jgi:hypothetical protein
MTAQQMKPSDLEQLRRLSTCIVASAIEGFRVRLPNSGFTDSSISCIFKNRLPLIGCAATARIRSKNPPMAGHGYYYERADWWNHTLTIPAPRIIDRLREAICEQDPKS